VAQAPQARVAWQALQRGPFFYATSNAISSIVFGVAVHSEKLAKEMVSLK